MFSTVKSRILSLYSTARRRPFISVGILLVVVFGAWFFVFKGDNKKEETLTVHSGDFVQEISVAGKVVAEQKVDLSFKETGHVERVLVKVGDKVHAGQALATLAIDTLASDLRVAEINLEEVRKEQGTLVASAYRNLLSDNLVAVPNASSYGVAAPTITGIYDGPEGTYKIQLSPGTQFNLNQHELRVFGLEIPEAVLVLRDEPTTLGTRGLFITFPDALGGYDETTWYVTIPNTKSSSYLANYNAYQEARRMSDKTIANGEAEIARIKTDIAERFLRAPFDGTVTAVPAKVGSIASASDIAISLISAKVLQIECFIPEVNIVSLAVGNTASTTLDAYGPDTFFGAKVVAIDPAETVRDGVSTYRTTLEFTQQDARIRPGMTANIHITTQEKHGVIVIPQGAIVERDGKNFVQIKNGDATVEREIEIGARSLGDVEVVSGLGEGDTIVLNP